VLVGGQRITHVIDDPEKRQPLRTPGTTETAGSRITRCAASGPQEHQANGFAMAMGGGVDFVVNRGLASRVGNIKYTYAWIPDADQIHASDGVRFTSGLTLRIGMW
jgi:hypothetical protein